MQRVQVPSEVLDQWQQVVEAMADLIDVPSAIITRVDPPQIEVLRASSNPDNPHHAGARAEMAGHYCEEVVHSGQRLRIPDARKMERWKTAPEIDYGVVSYLGYPVTWPDGEVFGTICVLDTKENHYGQRYERLIAQFKNLLEAHLALICTNQQLTRALDEVQRLRGILPICAGCKSIRDEQGVWQQLERYVTENSEVMFSHSLCPRCAESYCPSR